VHKPKITHHHQSAKPKSSQKRVSKKMPQNCRFWSPKKHIVFWTGGAQQVQVAGVIFVFS
jgi:hypothetical protein